MSGNRHAHGPGKLAGDRLQTSSHGHLRHTCKQYSQLSSQSDRLLVCGSHGDDCKVIEMPGKGMISL